MRFLPAAILVCLLAACQQPSEASLKDMTDRCIGERDLSACDDLVNMRGLSDLDRAQAYAARARTLANLGKTEDAIHDLDAAIKLDPGNKQLVLFKILLVGSMSQPTP
jgi:tetratricopeptide (TPR) repeat protein